MVDETGPVAISVGCNVTENIVSTRGLSVNALGQWVYMVLEIVGKLADEYIKNVAAVECRQGSNASTFAFVFGQLNHISCPGLQDASTARIVSAEITAVLRGVK